MENCTRDHSRLWGWFCAILVLGGLPAFALGGPIENVFEIDGNPQDGAGPGLDWCCLDDGSCLADPRVKAFSNSLTFPFHS